MDDESSQETVVDSFRGSIAVLQEEEIALLTEMKNILDQTLTLRQQMLDSQRVGVWDALEQQCSALKQQEEAVNEKLISLRKKIERLKTLRIGIFVLKVSAVVVSSIVISGFAVKYYFAKFRNSGTFINVFNIIFK